MERREERRLMKNEEELISVIIPVYNVKSYLRKCADSVFAQTFRNLEIILIDDGSTDGSGELCDQLAEEDARVRVIHKENRGPAEARNVGIRASTGDYLYFLDSDDAISAVTLNHLWTACIRTKADVAFGDFIRFSEEEIPGERRTFTVQPVETKEMIRRMLLNQGVGHQAWGKLYRRSLWENLRFPDAFVAEDQAVIYDVVLKAGRAAAVTDAMYYYRVREGSLINTEVTEKNLAVLDISERVTKLVSGRFPDLYEPAVRLQVVVYMRLLSSILETDYHMYPEVQKRIIDTVRGYKDVFLKSKDVRRVDKLKLRSLLAGKRVFYLIYKASDQKKRK